MMFRLRCARQDNPSQWPTERTRGGAKVVDRMGMVHIELDRVVVVFGPF